MVSGVYLIHRKETGSPRSLSPQVLLTSVSSERTGQRASMVIWALPGPSLKSVTTPAIQLLQHTKLFPTAGHFDVLYPLSGTFFPLMLTKLVLLLLLASAYTPLLRETCSTKYLQYSCLDSRSLYHYSHLSTLPMTPWSPR